MNGTPTEDVVTRSRYIAQLVRERSAIFEKYLAEPEGTMTKMRHWLDWKSLTAEIQRAQNPTEDVQQRSLFASAGGAK